MGSNTSTKLFGNKKGWFAQAIIGVVILFALVLVWSLTFMAQSIINDDIQSDTTLDNSSKVIMQNQTTAYPNTFDGAIGFVAVILWIIVLALAYKGASNPLFILVAIVVIGAIGFVGMILSNAWNEIDTDPELSTYTSEFPISGFILDYFLTFVLVMFFSSVMVYVYANGGLG